MTWDWSACFKKIKKKTKNHKLSTPKLYIPVLVFLLSGWAWCWPGWRLFPGPDVSVIQHWCPLTLPEPWGDQKTKTLSGLLYSKYTDVRKDTFIVYTDVPLSHRSQWAASCGCYHLALRSQPVRGGGRSPSGRQFGWGLQQVSHNAGGSICPLTPRRGQKHLFLLVGTQSGQLEGWATLEEEEGSSSEYLHAYWHGFLH